MPPTPPTTRRRRLIPWLAALAVLAALAGLTALTRHPLPGTMAPAPASTVSLTPSLPFGRD